MTELHLDGVTKRFGHDVVALDDITATVATGSLHAVLGPSGCGKTTLLRVLAGFESIDAGCVRFDDDVVTTSRRVLPPERRRVGIVPQDGALFPHLDVAANVAFGLRRTGAAPRRARVAELLALTSLEGLGARRPHELSGGQQQRVALARALAPNPRVVLLDEPFAALDTGLRAGLRADVATALRAAGATAVLVTHDQAEAFSMADTVSVMRAGSIVQTASPATLYHEPVDLDTARFVGSVVLLTGTVDDDVATCALGRLPVRRPARERADVTVMIRPEQIAPVGGGGVTAVVRHVRFEGAAVVVGLDLGGTVVDASWPAHAAPQVATTVCIGVQGPVTTFPAAGTRPGG